MEFRDSYRMEAIYFQTLKEEINRVKNLMSEGNTEQAKTLLENAVNVDGAVLLLYRNLGELWAELGAKIEETKKELEKLDSRVDDYHRELNEKIDDVNNTIIRIINALEERVKALEDCCKEVQEALANKQDKLTAGQNITIDENNVISSVGGGSDDVFILSVEYDSSTDVYTPDKTYSEVRAAVLAGKVVLCRISQYDEYDWYVADRNYLDTSYNPDIHFYTLHGVYIDDYDNKQVTLIYNYNQFGQFLNNTLYEPNPGIYGLTAKVNNSNWSLSITASSLFKKITSELRCAYIQYLDSNNNFNGTMELVLSAVQNGSAYEFKTNARTYTASAGNAYPVSPV